MFNYSKLLQPIEMEEIESNFRESSILKNESFRRRKITKYFIRATFLTLLIIGWEKKGKWDSLEQKILSEKCVDFMFSREDFKKKVYLGSEFQNLLNQYWYYREFPEIGKFINKSWRSSRDSEILQKMRFS